MHVRCLAQGLAPNSEIMFSLPSLRGNNSNQRKVKDSGCQFLAHFGPKITFEITFLNFCSLSVAVLIEYTSGCPKKSSSVHPYFIGKKEKKPKDCKV